MRMFLVYGAGLTALYLLVSHATQGGQLLSAASNGVVSVAKTFQGR